MSIKSLNESISKATKLVTEARQKLNEDAAAVVALTAAVKKAPTVFVIASTGVSINTLTEKIKAFANPSSTVEQTGDSITITSTNPAAVQRVLKLLRVSATVQGDVLLQPAEDNPEVVAPPAVAIA